LLGVLHAIVRHHKRRNLLPPISGNGSSGLGSVEKNRPHSRMIKLDRAPED
jgi:hypothetical protein